MASDVHLPIQPSPQRLTMSASAASSTHSTSSDPVSAPAVAEKPAFSPLFDDDPDGKADIVLRSIDGVHFAVCRASLAAASTVFDDMLEIPQPPKKRQKMQSQSGGLSVERDDVVQLEERSQPLEIFLRHIITRAYLQNDAAPTFLSFATFKDIALFEDVLEMANKYDTPFVFDALARLHLPELTKQWPLYGWAVACEFGRLELARAALRAFAHKSKTLAGAKRWKIKTSKYEQGRRDVCLGDVRSDYIAKLSPSTIRNFCAVHAKVVGSKNGSYTWLSAADEFEL